MSSLSSFPLYLSLSPFLHTCLVSRLSYFSLSLSFLLSVSILFPSFHSFVQSSSLSFVLLLCTVPHNPLRPPILLNYSYLSICFTCHPPASFPLHVHSTLNPSPYLLPPLLSPPAHAYPPAIHLPPLPYLSPLRSRPPSLPPSSSSETSSSRLPLLAGIICNRWRPIICNPS